MDLQRENDGIVEIAGRKVRYIDPLTDWGFKRLFGTEVNKEILLGFLQDLFPEKRIEDITYLNPEQSGITSDDRKAVFDVSCRTAAGEEFIVEMQKEEQAYFRDRALYYSTFPIQEQGRKGDWNYKLSPVYMVGILDFRMNHPVSVIGDGQIEEKLIYRYVLKEIDTGELMTENIEFVFIEVGAFDREDRLVTMMDKWMFVLKNLGKLMDRPAELQERIFRKLFKAAEIAAFTKEELDQYENNMMTKNDYKNTIDYARYEGHKAGLEEGRKEGIAEGIMTIAKKLLNSGMDAEHIASVTGLSIAQIKKL